MKLIFSVLLLAVATLVAAQTTVPEVTHTAEKGETVYGISRRYGVSVATLMELNPQLRDGLRAGQTLLIFPGTQVPEQQPEQPQTEVPAPAAPTHAQVLERYVVAPKETFYSIAHKHGITVAELEEANPDVTILKAGQVLIIPQRQVVEEQPLPEQPIEESTPPRRQHSVAILLPLMATDEEPGKAAQHYTEFVRGFLMGLDTLRHEVRGVRLQVFDTQDNVDTLRSILGRLDTPVDILVAPPGEEALALVADYGQQHNVPVLNNFVVRDRSWTSNPAMLQANMPQEDMQRLALREWRTLYPDHTPVVLRRRGARTEHQDFIDLLAVEGPSAMVIEYDERPTADDLSVLPDRPITFFTPHSSQSELNRLLPALIDYRNTREHLDENDTLLFGYPEWTAFRGQTLADMHRANTAVYTRFFLDDNAWETGAFNEQYRAIYGAPPADGLPRQAVWGFDTAAWLLRALTFGQNVDSRGIQNDFAFRRRDDHPEGGAVNTAIYLVNFRPDNTVARHPLRL